MASSALERIRQAHEEVETLTCLTASALSARDGGSTAMFGDHAPHTALEASQLARQLVNEALSRCDTLANMYQNTDGTLSDYAFTLRAPGAPSSQSYLRPFYEQLRDLRALHRSTSPSSNVVHNLNSSLLLKSLPPITQWTPEEVRGTCLDLHTHHASFQNIMRSGAKRNDNTVDYVAYVRGAIVEFDAVPAKTRRSRAYADYINEVIAYLESFAKRAYPLDEVKELIIEERNRLLDEQRKVRERLTARFGVDAEAALRSLSITDVTSQLNMFGLKTGGRPVERASRLLTHARSGEAVQRVIAEGVLRYIVTELLAEECVATAHNAEKKLALSYSELEAERRAQEAASLGSLLGPEDEEGEGVGEEAPVYNPKDVPLGWDGKPIPYWLYKLHGLNHEYKCEICGDAVYRGPRAFERHFSQAQHVQGLRCLGIRYSKEYLMITRIADATALALRLARQNSVEIGDGDVEFEDAEGNVLSRKTHEDLARQGLLS